MSKNHVDKNFELQTVPNTPFAFIQYVTRPHVWWLLGVLLAVAVGQFISTSMPYIFKSLIDTAQKVSTGEALVNDVWFWAFVYPIAVSIMFITWRVSGFLGMELASRANETSYKILFAYITYHSHTYFSDRFAGSLSSKIGHASDGIESILEAFMWNYFPSILSLVITIGYLCYLNFYIALIFMGLVFVLVPLNIILVRYRQPYVVRYSSQATKTRGYAVDAITNISAIRQFVRMEEEKKEFNAHIEEKRRLNIKQWRISEWVILLNNIIIVFFDTIILFVAVYLWNIGTFTIGELIMVTALMVSIQNTLVYIGMNMNGFIRRYGEVEEGLVDIVLPHEIVDAKDAKEINVTRGEIVFSQVNFNYEDNSVFNDFNLTINSGERVGLVGTSGAGKTTLVSILLRQHELNSGSITIDGQDISLVTQDSLRKNIAVVPQEPLLFHRSIRDNIAYGKLNAIKGEIISVAKKAQADEFIRVLPSGYDTLVGERGVKLSGGQKQRVALARAMLKNAPILVLDEATSALDSESEIAIQKALHELMKGKTVIAIAHRLSTLREMDRIIVIDSGKIVESGTHDELVKTGGLYERLWKHQASGFLGE